MDHKRDYAFRAPSSYGFGASLRRAGENRPDGNTLNQKPSTDPTLSTCLAGMSPTDARARPGARQTAPLPDRVTQLLV